MKTCINQNISQFKEIFVMPVSPIIEKLIKLTLLNYRTTFSIRSIMVNVSYNDSFSCNLALQKKVYVKVRKPERDFHSIILSFIRCWSTILNKKGNMYIHRHLNI